MNKKLLAIAVGAALAVPMVARADVTVYGRAQVELQNKKTQLGSVTTTERGLVDNEMGRIGINATEDLGDGMTGLAHFGFIADTSPQSGDSGGISASRQAYVGIVGLSGTVRFGRLAGAYKDTNTDPYIATALEARALGGESAGDFGHDGFINDAIKYTSKFGNVKFGALMTAGNSTNGDNGDYQLAADFQGETLRIIMAYSKNRHATGPDTPDERRTKLAVQYGIGPGKLTAQFEKAKDYSSANDPSLGLVGDVGEADFYMLSYNAHFGHMNSLYIRGGREKYRDMAASPGGLKLKSYAVALQRRMSKTFRVWAGYFQTKTDPTAKKISSVSLGMRKDF